MNNIIVVLTIYCLFVLGCRDSKSSARVHKPTYIEKQDEVFLFLEDSWMAFDCPDALVGVNKKYTFLYYASKHNMSEDSLFDVMEDGIFINRELKGEEAIEVIYYLRTTDLSKIYRILKISEGTYNVIGDTKNKTYVEYLVKRILKQGQKKTFSIISRKKTGV